MIYESRFSLNGYYRVAGISEIASDIAKNAEWVNAINERGETPLHIAARHKKFDLFKLMLPHFTKIEACDSHGNTVLHSLLDNSVDIPSKSEKRCSELIEVLMSKGGDVNKRNRHGWTPVHMAARNCQIDVLHVLEMHKPNLRLRAENGETALHLACRNMGHLVDTPTEIEIVNNLVIHGCDVTAKNVKGHSVLHYAVEYCGVRVVEKLIDCGADLDCQTESLQLTPLHLATRKKSFIVMEALIKAGANVNAAAYAGLTPLHLAVIIGSWDTTKLLIDNDAEVDCCDQWSPLHLAIHLKHKDLFKLLIRYRANVNVSGVDRLTPLHVATMSGNFKFAKTLIDRGANVNCRDKNKFTPLHASIKNSRYPYLCRLVQNSIHAYLKNTSFSKHFVPFFSTTSSRGHKMISRVLLQNGADVNAMTKSNESPLYFAAENGNVKILRILLKLGAKIDIKEKSYGFTPLHAATRWNHVDVVRELVSADANLEITAHDGKNPLHLATFYNRVGVVKELLNGNVDVNVTTKYGRTALHLATRYNYVDTIKELLNNNADVNIRDKDGRSPLHLAVEKKNAKVFKLLFKRGAGVSEEDKRLRNSPLHIAARENNDLMIQFLIKFGAKVNAANEDGFTPLHYAVSNNSVDAVNMLIGFDAYVNCKTNRHQLTPLHLAFQQYSGDEKLLNILINANADVSAGDVDGVTPLHLVVLSGYPSEKSVPIIESLISQGADFNCADRVLRFTPLHIVVNERDEDVFNLLMESGANVNSPGTNGLTPLHLASMLGDVDLAEALLHYGANVNCRDANMHTPLHFAICNARVAKKICAKVYSNESSLISRSLSKPSEFEGQNYKDLVELLIDFEADLNAVTISGESLFYFAVEANSVAFVKILMERGFPIDFEETHSGLTALQTAVLNDHRETVELLISCGADVKVVTESGKGLLHLAAESGGTRVLEYLLRLESHCYDVVKRCPFMYRINVSPDNHVKFDVNTKDHLGMTPLHVAALQSNKKQVTETLLVYGASADVEDNHGYLPIHYAIKNNRYQQLESFLAFGVDINDFKIYSKIDLHVIGYDSVVGYRMLQHLMKLKALQFRIANVYETLLQELRYSEDFFYGECKKEIEKLRVHYVGRGVSLYNLLHVKRRERRIHANNMEPRAIEREFPIYYSLILDFYHEAILKESLIKKAEFALFQLTEVDLPVVCTDKIFFYLGIISLVTLIRAAEMSCESSRKNLCLQIKDSEKTNRPNLFYALISKIINACGLAKEATLTFICAAALFLSGVVKYMYSIFNKWA